MEKYKNLWRIERPFRTMKSFLEIGPVGHLRSERLRSHVFVCVLSLLLSRFMERHDVRRESDERADLHRNIMERRKRIGSLQVRKGKVKIIESIAGSFLRYITYRIENNTVKTSARDNAISAAENRMGRFLLVYKGEYSDSSCLSVYRHRDAIEEAFRVLKTDLDIFPLRDHKESIVRGSVFVFFLSLLIRSALRRGMESTKLNEKYSMERMFLELEKLHMIEDQNGDLKELERTKKQKDILNLLNSVSWW